MWTTGVLADGFWTHPLTKSAALVLFLLFVSATWIETDVYRYAGGILALGAAIAWIRAGFRPPVGWMFALCWLWAAWVFLRYVIAVSSGDVHGHGSSEGIYLFPIFYSALGYALLIHRIAWREACVTFVVVSLLAALLTVDPDSSADGSLYGIFDTNNRIHGSIGAGFVVLAALNVMAYEGRTETDARMRWALEFLCLATVAVCAIGIIGAKAKGVWAALAVGLFVLATFAARDVLGRQARLTGILAAAATIGFVAVFHRTLWDTVAPSLEGLSDLALRAAASRDPVGVVRETLACGGLPQSAHLRLMMWHDAVEVWSNDWLFGNGVGWQDAYARAFYAGMGYDVVHNGYLEIAMRYGIVGLVFTLFVFAWSIAMASKAAGKGLIAPEAFRFHVAAAVYFLATMLTNANNRLSIGESYMIAVGAFGFYCYFAMQADGSRAPQSGGRAPAAPLAEP